MSDTQRWLTNAQMRSALLVLEELLGSNGRTAVLHLAGLERYIDDPPPNDARPVIPRGDVSAMFSGVASMFGDQGARGVLRRWGRAYAAKQAASRPALRLLRLWLRLLPPDRSARYVLTGLLRHVGLASEAHPPAVVDAGEYFLIALPDCVFCPGRIASRRSCMAGVGLLEGLLRWATHNDYEVSEDTPSSADGAPSFKIRKRPLGRR